MLYLRQPAAHSIRVLVISAVVRLPRSSSCGRIPVGGRPSCSSSIASRFSRLSSSDFTLEGATFASHRSRESVQAPSSIRSWLAIRTPSRSTTYSPVVGRATAAGTTLGSEQLVSEPAESSWTANDIYLVVAPAPQLGDDSPWEVWLVNPGHAGPLSSGLCAARRRARSARRSRGRPR
jgi:hypothetical protein